MQLQGLVLTACFPVIEHLKCNIYDLSLHGSQTVLNRKVAQVWSPSPVVTEDEISTQDTASIHHVRLI